MNATEQVPVPVLLGGSRWGTALEELRAQRRMNIMERRLVRRAEAGVVELRESGRTEDANRLERVLKNSQQREELVMMAIDEFENELIQSNRAIGDGEILKNFLTWLTEGGGFDKIMELVSLIFKLAGGL